MSSDLQNYVEQVLSRVNQDKFGRRDAPQVSLVDGGVTIAEDGAIAGCFQTRIRRRNGEEVVIQRQAFSGLRTREQVDDVLADMLSVLLMNHASWPR